jgi:hypothetical protein
VSIGKSVPNLISYLHEFFQNFSMSPAICFELISFRYFIKSEITDKRAPLVSRRAPLPHGRHAPRQRSGIKAAIGTARRASRQRRHFRPRAPTASRRAHRFRPPPRSTRRRPDSLVVAAVRAPPPRSKRARLPRRRPPSLVAAGEPTPPPRRLRAPASLAVAVQRRRAGPAPRTRAAGRTRALCAGAEPTPRATHVHCATGPSANSAQSTRVKFY